MNQNEMEREVIEVMTKRFLKDYMGEIGQLGNSPLMHAVEKQILGYTPELGEGLTVAKAHRMDRAVTAVLKRLSKDEHWNFNLSRKDIPRLVRRYR